MGQYVKSLNILVMGQQVSKKMLRCGCSSNPWMDSNPRPNPRARDTNPNPRPNPNRNLRSSLGFLAYGLFSALTLTLTLGPNPNPNLRSSLGFLA